MLRISTHYLHSAIRGHRTAFENFTDGDFEAVYLSAVLITLISTFLMSASDSLDESTAPFDESMWLRLAVGPRELVPVWKTLIQDEHPLTITGALREGPDLSDDAEVFRLEYGRPFDVLLRWATEFDYVSEDDSEAYQHTVSYVGLIYKVINEASEPPLATSRRLIAFPARAPPRFLDLALEKRPRALVILAHVVAMMKILAHSIPWYVGIAEKHIPVIESRLPSGWKPVMQWPMAVLHTIDGRGAPLPVPPNIDEVSPR